MMRQIAGLITGVLMIGYFMYFGIPMLYTDHILFSPLVNSTDATVVSSNNLGGMFYSALPIIPLLVGVFVVFNYALKRDPGE